MDRLRDEGMMVDYVSFVAHALPTREAICWAASCHGGDTPGTAAETGALAAEAVARTRAWVRDPQEGLRNQLLEMAERIGTDTASGWLCYAVAWNGSGSIVPPDNPPVMPEPFLHAKALLGAVALLSDGEDENAAPFLAHIDALARDVADGGWPGIEV